MLNQPYQSVQDLILNMLKVEIFFQWRLQIYLFIYLFIFLWGIEGAKCHSEGAKIQKNLPKMADFCHCFPLMGGKWGAEPQTGGVSDRGRQMPSHAP